MFPIQFSSFCQVGLAQRREPSHGLAHFNSMTHCQVPSGARSKRVLFVCRIVTVYVGPATVCVGPVTRNFVLPTLGFPVLTAVLPTLSVALSHSQDLLE